MFTFIYCLWIHKKHRFHILNDENLNGLYLKLLLLSGTNICLYTSQLIHYFFKHSTFVGSAWSFDFFIPVTAANDLRLGTISIPDHIHFIIFLSYFLRKSQYFPFQWWVLNKGTTGTSDTPSQHSTTRLSRRRSLTGDWTRDLPHSKPALFH